jgi:putative protein kinase ArgK-like GTPase of G3E family
LKKGITEMADIIFVNKADDPMDQGANQTLFEYKSAMKYALGGKSKKVPCYLYQLRTCQVLPISGRNGRGIPEAWDAIQEHVKSLQARSPKNLV